MRRVTGEEDAPFLEALRDVGDGLPGRDVIYRDRHARDADGRAQQLQRPLLGDASRDVRPRRPRVRGDDFRPGGVADEVDDEETRVSFAVEPEEPAQQGVCHVMDALVTAAQQRPEIVQRAEVDRDAV